MRNVSGKKQTTQLSKHHEDERIAERKVTTIRRHHTAGRRTWSGVRDLKPTHSRSAGPCSIPLCVQLQSLYEKWLSYFCGPFSVRKVSL